MERTGRTVTDRTMPAPRRGWRLGAGGLLFTGILGLAGCVVVPARHAYAPAYVAPAPVYVAPAPVYVAPGPRYYHRHYYGW